MAGKFISFEGGEGSGKSTQVQMLAAVLKSVGYNVVTTREPGGSPAAEEIRSLLVAGATDRWTPMAEVLLNYAAREMHVATTIAPALRRGDWVITDRFFDSTLAYQGYGGGIDARRIDTIRKSVLNDFAPDLTLVLDLPVEEGLERAGARLTEAGSGEDRYERMDVEFHRRLRKGFLAIAGKEPGRCRIVDATGSVDDIAVEIRAIVSDTFKVKLP